MKIKFVLLKRLLIFLSRTEVNLAINYWTADEYSMADCI